MPRPSTAAARLVHNDTFEWDAVVAGLALRRRQTRTPTWYVQIWTGGRTVRRSLGAAAALSVDDARAMARALIAELTGQTAPPPPLERSTVTVADFARRHLDQRASSWKPATLKAHRSSVERSIVPCFGPQAIAAVTSQQVALWFTNQPGSQGTRNRALAVLSGMMRHAELLGVRSPGSNPALGLRRRRNRFQAHPLAEDDYRRLGEALKQIEGAEPAAVGIIRFMALTGCRKSEAVLLRWDMIDANRVALPDSKTGPRSIWLGRPARAILASCPLTAPFVFAAETMPLSMSRLATVWGKLRVDIGLPHVRLHDLRHGFATVAISSGEPLRTVSGLLAHSELQTTAGYTHYAEAPVRRAAERVAAHLAKTLGPPSSGPLPEAPPLVAAFLAQGKSLRDYAAERNVSVSTLRQKVGAHLRLTQAALGHREDA